MSAVLKGWWAAFDAPENRHTLFGHAEKPMLSFSDTLAVLGALGLGAMFDVAIKPPYKKRVSDWLVRLASRAGKISYGGSAFLDRIFGRAVLSWRVVPRYALISLVSIGLSYGFAVFSSPSDVQPQIQIFKGFPSALDLLILIMCFGAAVAGDIFSYAQTRLFVRAIDRSRSVVVSAGLVAADLVVSLAIFFTTFSIARLVCMLLVLQVAPVQKMTHTDVFAPELLAAALAEAGVEVGDKEPASAFAVALANAKSPKDLAAVAEMERRLLATQFKNPNALRDVHFGGSRTCSGRTRDEIVDAGAAVKASQDLFLSVMAEQGKRRPLTVDAKAVSEKMGTAFYTAVGGVLTKPGSNACPVAVTTLKAETTASAFVADAGPFNAFAAAFERTLFDAYSVVGYKLAPYVAYDPYSSAPQYFRVLETLQSTSVLGAFPIDVERAQLTSFFDDPVEAVEGRLNVPFTPMVASALTTSAFLIAYLLSLAFAALQSGIRSIAARFIPAFDLERAVFTSVSIALVGAFLSLALATWALQGLWRLLLGQ